MRSSVPKLQGWAPPAGAFVLLAHIFHFQRKAEIPGVMTLFWAPEQDLKHVPVFVSFFQQEGDYTIAGLGFWPSGPLASPNSVVSSSWSG